MCGLSLFNYNLLQRFVHISTEDNDDIIIIVFPKINILTHSIWVSYSFDVDWTVYFDILNILLIKLEPTYCEQMFPKHCRRSNKSLNTRRQ